MLNKKYFLLSLMSINLFASEVQRSFLPLEKLSPQVFRLIASYLTSGDILRCSEVSKKMKALTDREQRTISLTGDAIIPLATDKFWQERGIGFDLQERDEEFGRILKNLIETILRRFSGSRIRSLSLYNAEGSKNISIEETLLGEYKCLEKLLLYNIDCKLLKDLPDVSKLKYLNLSHIENNGEGGDLRVIGRVPHLETLIMKHNSLTNLPTEIAQLRNLKVLDVSYNPDLKFTLPESLAELEEVHLAEISLEEIPLCLKAQKKLKKLDLTLNYGLDFLNLIGLTELEELDLTNCNLAALPLELFFLQKLKRLSLVNNKPLRRLDADLTPLNQLPALEEVDLTCSDFTVRPAGIDQRIIVKI
jgi:hypothetical protein